MAAATAPFETIGVNGSDVYTKPVGTGQEMVALFGSLNRTMDPLVLQRLLEKAYDDTEETFADLTVLAFHTRDILEGKGERALFYRMIWFLYEKNPTGIHKVLEHVSEYGAWLDLQQILKYGPKENSLMFKTIVSIYAKQLLADFTALNEGKTNLTLAAKWVPRENKRHGWLAHPIALAMFPSVKSKIHRLKLYRQLVTKVNAHLDTVERKMCHDAQNTHHFADIDPAKVPSRCLLRKRPAFFNELAPNKKQKSRHKNIDLRHPDDPDRMACRARFLEHVQKALCGKSKVHGKVLMPHEFVVESMKLGLVGYEQNKSAWDTLQAQWNNMRDTVRARQSLGKTVVMCDFSGSMAGMPMNVSEGLGLLCAECTSPAFRDRLITFDKVPTWHNLERAGPTFYKRLASFAGVSQGTSTNFQAAVDLVLNRLVEAQVPVGEEPDILLVLTDMGWDAANNGDAGWDGLPRAKSADAKFETHIDRIQREFAAKGGWKVPTIVIWNISGKFQEYHHKSDTPGVCVISGWSPAILKYIVQGDDIVAKLQSMTPFVLMRQVLDDTRYAPIRESLATKKACIWAGEDAAADAGAIDWEVEVEAEASIDWDEGGPMDLDLDDAAAAVAVAAENAADDAAGKSESESESAAAEIATDAVSEIKSSCRLH